MRPNVKEILADLGEGRIQISPSGLQNVFDWLEELEAGIFEYLRVEKIAPFDVESIREISKVKREFSALIKQIPKSKKKRCGVDGRSDNGPKKRGEK